MRPRKKVIPAWLRELRKTEVKNLTHARAIAQLVGIARRGAGSLLEGRLVGQLAHRLRREL